MQEYGLLLVNLGSPANPSIPAVRSYLRQFLGDPNVITLPRWLWKPILSRMILPKRPAHSAKLYHDIWLPDGSPLIVYTRKLTARIQEQLPEWDVQMAMTYGQPSISKTIQQMQQHCHHIIVLSLFPHFTQSTTTSIIEQVQAIDPTIPIIQQFADQPAYLNLLAKHIQRAWDHGNYQRLFISYHGIPQSMVKHGDPYQQETRQTTAELCRRLDIPQEQIQMTYQSKFGPLSWLQPYLHETLIHAADQGLKRALLVTPSFVADCLETLHENGFDNRQAFLDHGGEQLTVMPSLNADPDFASFIAQLAQAKVASLTE